MRPLPEITETSVWLWRHYPNLGPMIIVFRSAAGNRAWFPNDSLGEAASIEKTHRRMNCLMACPLPSLRTLRARPSSNPAVSDVHRAAPVHLDVDGCGSARSEARRTSSPCSAPAMRKESAGLPSRSGRRTREPRRETRAMHPSIAGRGPRPVARDASSDRTRADPRRRLHRPGSQHR